MSLLGAAEMDITTTITHNYVFVIKNPADVNDSLAFIWKHIFSEKSTDEGPGKRNFELLWSTVGLGPGQPPLKIVQRVVDNLIDSAPGIEGCPQYCWKDAKEAAICNLCDLSNVFV